MVVSTLLTFQEIGVCDYPYNVDCRGTPAESHVTTVAPTSVPDNSRYEPWLKRIPASKSGCMREILVPLLAALVHVTQATDTCLFLQDS